MVEGNPKLYRKTVGDVIYDALRSALNAPENDKFIVISEHSPAEMMISPDYLNIQQPELHCDSGNAQHRPYTGNEKGVLSRRRLRAA